MNRDSYGYPGVDDRGGDPYQRRGAVRYSGAVPTSGGQRRAGSQGGDARSGGRSDRRRLRPAMPLWQELPLLLIVAFCLAVLIRTFLLQAFFIPSGSMQETLAIGDRVLVNKIVYDIREPLRGEVLVFKGTDNWAPEQGNTPPGSTGFLPRLGRTIGDLVGVSQPGEKDFIKRVVGLPGDVVACCDAQGRVTVNGAPLNGTGYLHTDSALVERPSGPQECGSRRFGPITVEPGQMFVMGDHRAVSMDSRCQGQVPIDNVIGRAFVIVWPSARWSSLPVPAEFATIPRPAVAMGVPQERQPLAPVELTHGAVLLLPILASLMVPARSRTRRWIGPRKLRV